MDYNYFSYYSLERQIKVHDPLIRQHLKNKPFNLSSPIIKFSVGSFGAGKTHTLKWLNEKKEINLDEFVLIDPDFIKRLLPEWDGFIKENASTAATRLHKELTFIAMLIERAALFKKYNIIVDGSLQNADCYESWFEYIRSHHCHYQNRIIAYSC